MLSLLTSNKLLIGSVVLTLALSIFTGWLWMDRENKSILFEQQASTISRLNDELEAEKQRTKLMTEQLDALNEAHMKVRGNLESKRLEVDNILRGIDNVNKTNKGISDNSLDSDIKRMLDDVCRKVRGGDCPIPNS